MKTLEVCCAIIQRQGKILIAQRPPGTHLAGYWEFPGGKKEKKESIEESLEREVFEELGILIRPQKLFRIAEHTYPDRKVVLFFYFCDWVSGKPVRHACFDFRWVAPHALRQFRFPPADSGVIQELIAKKTWVFWKTQ